MSWFIFTDPKLVQIRERLHNEKHHEPGSVYPQTAPLAIQMKVIPGRGSV